MAVSGGCSKSFSGGPGQLQPVQTTLSVPSPLEFQEDALTTAQDRIEEVSGIADTWLGIAKDQIKGFEGVADIGVELIDIGPLPERTIKEYPLPEIPETPDLTEGLLEVSEPEEPGDISIPSFTDYPFPDFTQSPPDLYMTDPPSDPELPGKYVPTPVEILSYQAQVKEFEAFMEAASPTLDQVSIPDTSIPEFTVESPYFSFPSPPDVEFPDDPGPAPTMSEISTPSAPGYTLPPVPTISELDIPEAPEVHLPTFEASRPDNSLLSPPGELVYYQEEEYISQLKSQVYDKLLSEIQEGGTGLSADVEQAIWNRAISRLDQELERNYEEIDQGWAARGFNFPAGAMMGMRSRVRRDIDDKKLDLNRDIMVEQARLAQQNTQFIIERAVNYEQALMDHHNRVAQRAFELARLKAETGIAIYNAKVNAYAAMIEGYKADAEVFRAKLQAALSELEAYKTRMEGVRIAADVQRLYIDLYNAQLQSVMTMVEIYKAEMQGAAIKADVEKTRIQAYAEQVNAFISRIRAGTARFEAYQAEVQGRLGEVQGYSEQVRAYGMQVDAAKTGADIKTQQAQVQLDNQRMVIEKYRSEIEKYNADIQNYTMQIQAYAESNRDRQAEAQVGLDTQRLMSEVESQAASIEIERGKLAADIFRANMARSEMDVRAFEARMGGYEVESRVFAARIEAAKSRNEIDTQRIRTMVDVEMAGIEIYKAKISKLSAVMSANASLIGSKAQMFGSQASMVQSQYQGAASMYSSDADVYRADLGAFTAKVDAVTKEAELHIRAAETEASLAIEGMRTTAQVAGQIAAAALTSINATASVGYSASEQNSVSHGMSYGYQTSHSTSNSWQGAVSRQVSESVNCQDVFHRGEYHQYNYEAE